VYYIFIMESRLTYLEDAGFIQYKNQKCFMVKCQCNCGKIITVRKQNYKSKKTKSCGCITVELSKKLNASHGLTNSGTYRSWSAMLTRCTNKKTAQYHNYGGRGILVCDRWKKFELFLEDMGIKPTEKHQLDRIDNNGNYDILNCRWVTRLENCNNKNNNSRFNYRGEFLSTTEISRRTGILRSRISNWKNRSNYSNEKIELLIENLSNETLRV